MRVSEIEVSVKYQPANYTSSSGAVRVVLEDGDNIEDVAQFAAEQAARTATAGSPNRNFQEGWFAIAVCWVI
ncbi:MAG: hypothetical protein WBA93_36400 [Microcoleaceae cyanobacterium]